MKRALHVAPPGCATCRWALTAIVTAAGLAGCGYVDYYWQGFTGQAELVVRARPIDEVLAGTADAKLAERLQRVREIRAFATRELKLPDNPSYTRYAELGRPFVVWNVIATPALSLTPRQWCFPVAGCVGYRGYFDASAAEAEATRLAAAGDDVYVGGVPAYSTLGWFADPVLSTFIRYPDTALARLVFHELAHQVVYVKDDSEFNESFATAVEGEGVKRWIASQVGTPQHAALVAELARGEKVRADFQRLLQAARLKLAAIYASDASQAEKLEGKAAGLRDLTEAYQRARADDGGLAALDRWFAGRQGQGVNNASLAAARLYDGKLPAFQELLAATRGDLSAFYARVAALAALPRDERDRQLAPRRSAASTH